MITQVQFPENGDVFRGRYKILDTVGRGGFSRVYHAEQIDLGRAVAIKVLKPVTDSEQPLEAQQAKFDSVSKRFEREAKLVSKLKDPHTVVMHDYGRTDAGLFFMVLEFIDGFTIGQLIQDEGGPLTPERVVKILKQCLTSLEEAHHIGVLHRDIKPGNIMVYNHIGRTDNVKVLDFGIAKTIDDAAKDKTSSSELTADGMLVGTPRYMSPEQIRGHELAPSSDLYSLGLVAYEMLMGVKAIRADSSIKIISRHLDTDPIELPQTAPLPLGLRSIVNGMLAKQPSRRYQSCRDVIDALDTWQSDPSHDVPFVFPDVTGSVDIEVLETPETSGRWIALGVIVAVILIGVVFSLILADNGSDSIGVVEIETIPTGDSAIESTGVADKTTDSVPKPDIVAIAEPELPLIEVEKPDVEVGNAEPTIEPEIAELPLVATKVREVKSKKPKRKTKKAKVKPKTPPKSAVTKPVVKPKADKPKTVFSLDR